MAGRKRKGSRPVPPVRTIAEIRHTGDVRTTEDVRNTHQVVTPGKPSDGEDTECGEPLEDEDVVSVGSYESWDQTGQSLDAAGSGMTGDSGSVGLTGTGFEDDTDLD